jgi:flagellar biosynthesis protein
MPDEESGGRARPQKTPGKESPPADRSIGNRRSAFALQYDPSSDLAPRLVAKGRGKMADRILNLAESASVPVVQDPYLAGVLAGVDLDCEIPPRLYAAVAEVLVHVAKLEQQAKKESWKKGIRRRDSGGSSKI